MSGDRDRQNRRDSKQDATPARPSSARAGKDNRANRTRTRSARRNGNDAGRDANQRRGVGSLGLDLEGHGSNRNGVGSLGLELEGQGRDGVGTLNLPLEGSQRGVGSLGLDLEGRDAPRRSGVGSLDLELEGDNKGRGRGKSDEAEGLAGATSEPTAEAPQATPEVSAQPEGEGQLAGSIPLITGPGLNKSKGDLDDLGRIAEASQAATGTATGARGGVPVVLDLDVSFDNSPGTGSATTQKQDPGEGSFNLSFSQPGGRAVSPFGSEFYEPEFANVAWKLEDGKCKISADLKINCPWGTADGGKIDVPSGTDSVVTKDNWQQVRDDLKPSSASPHKSPRTQYYSKSLVERHERFHGTDDWGWSQSSGVALVNAKCAATNINAGSAAAQVTSLMQTCRQLLISENFKWYKGGGSSHDSYAGEIRAYGDGKPHYAALATAVETHGRTL